MSYINNHNQLPNGSTQCREKEVKAKECVFYLDNGFSVDTLRGFALLGESE